MAEMPKELELALAKIAVEAEKDCSGHARWDDFERAILTAYPLIARAVAKRCAEICEDNGWTQDGIKQFHMVVDQASLALDLQAEIDGLRRERDELLNLSANLDEHPDDYDGPCMCKTCQQYADVDETALDSALAGKP